MRNERGNVVPSLRAVLYDEGDRKGDGARPGFGLLVELGYTVLGAGGGGEALEILKKKGVDIHLILTDIVMPQRSGRELALQAAALRPGIRVLYMSGYPRSEREKEEELPSGIPFIQKPFSPLTLARMVRGALDNPPASN